MKVKPYRVCDVCGAEIDKNTDGRLLIKERWTWSSWGSFEAGYKRLDLCSNCSTKMFIAIRKMIEEEK